VVSHANIANAAHVTTVCRRLTRTSPLTTKDDPDEPDDPPKAALATGKGLHRATWNLRWAGADAALLVGLLAVVLAPLPALLLEAPAVPSAVLPGLIASAPVFALPPFLLGGGFGTLLHLTVTARDRTAAIAAGSREVVSPPSLIASSLLMAAVFGSVGFTLAAALSQAA